MSKYASQMKIEGEIANFREYNLGLIVRVMSGDFAKIGQAARASPISQNL